MGGIDIVDFNSVLLNILKVSFLSEMPIEAMQAHLRNTTCLLRHFKCVWAHRPLGTSMGHNLITFVVDRLWLLRIKHQITTHQWLNRSVIFFQKHSILWCMLDVKWAGTSSNFCSSFWSTVFPIAFAYLHSTFMVLHVSVQNKSFK